MHEADQSSGRPLGEPVDLARFGFDDGNGRWIDCFREAASPGAPSDVGSYEILDEIGRGGQGVVYRARQPGTGRIVAVKRLLGGRWASPGARRRFEDEARVVSSLRHPAVVTLFTAEMIDSQPVLAMEWIEGAPITRWAAGRSVREMSRVLVLVCDGVHHAHQRGVIHCDLKPSNILIDMESQPRVLDFGLARWRGENWPSDSAADIFAGTLAYAAPEQLGGAAPDVRTDVYSLGVVLYEMLTGKRPHEVPTPPASINEPNHTRDIKAPSLLNAHIPRELDCIVLQCLAADPDRRYPSVDKLGDDLRRFLNNEAVTAHPPSALYHLRKSWAKYRMALSVAAAAAICVSSFALWSWNAWRETIVARDNERRARAVTDCVNAFLQSTLSTALPSRSGADVTLLAAMAEAGARAERELADQPEVAAEVHYSIGSTLNALWRWREALPHVEKSVAISRSLGLTNDARYAARLVELGRTLTSLARPEAVAVQEEALALRRSVFAEPHPLVAESLMRLAYAQHQSAKPPRWDEAELRFNESLGMYRALGGDHRRALASCLHNFGWMRYRQNRLAEADALYAESLELYRAIGHNRDPFYAELLHGYTALLLLRGKNAESLALSEEAIPLVASVYGEGGAEPLHWRAAAASQRIGKLDEARRWYLSAIDLFCSGVIMELIDSADQPATLIEQLGAIRTAVATSGESDSPPFARLLELKGSLPKARRARLQRYEDYFSEYEKMTGESNNTVVDSPAP